MGGGTRGSGRRDEGVGGGMREWEEGRESGRRDEREEEGSREEVWKCGRREGNSEHA